MNGRTRRNLAEVTKTDLGTPGEIQRGTFQSPVGRTAEPRMYRLPVDEGVESAAYGRRKYLCIHRA